MASIPLSLAEKTLILHGVDANHRNDGRRRCEYRFVEIETKVMEQSNGSARLRIGNSDVIASVKLEVDTTHPERPFEGKLEFFTDCSANATPDFEGRGGEVLAMEISNMLSLAYQSSRVFDLRTLCILPSKKCWKMYIDILILQCGGNLFDAISAAVKAALYSAEIPKVATAALDGGETDVQLSDDINDSIKLNVTNFPLFVTLCKIGDHCIVDPTVEEEMCSSASVILSVSSDGKVTSTEKTGYGSFQMSTLIKSFETGSMVGVKLNSALMEALRQESELGTDREIYGFLR